MFVYICAHLTYLSKDASFCLHREKSCCLPFLVSYNAEYKYEMKYYLSFHLLPDFLESNGTIGVL